MNNNNTTGLCLHDQSSGLRRFYAAWIDNQAMVVPWVALAALLCVCLSVIEFGLPVPAIHDEFVYLLQADTFVHGRLANPPLALPDFFENYHLLMAPTYAGKYPPGQGLVLALGQILGHPAIGVWMSIILMCSTIAWAIKRIVAPVWAIFAGAYCAVHFGIWHYWTTSYWGGSVAAVGGALVLGGTFRLMKEWRLRNAVLLGLGIIVLLFTRPFEGGLLCLVPAFVLFRRAWLEGAWRKSLWLGFFIPTSMVVLAGAGFLLYYNKSVTGSALKMPYMVYEETYSRAPIFVWDDFGPPPVFSRHDREVYYNKYVALSSRFDQPIWMVYFSRLKETLDNFGGWFGVVGIVVALLFAGRSSGATWVLYMVGIGSLSFVLSYWHSVHYQAPSLAAWVVLMALGWAALSRLMPRPAYLWLCAVIGVLIVIGDYDTCSSQAKMRRMLTAFSFRRVNVAAAVTAGGAKHIIFVNRGSDPNFHQEWAYNGAELSEGAVIWAHDLGDARNVELHNLYPERTCWRLTLMQDGGVLQGVRFPSPGK